MRPPIKLLGQLESGKGEGICDLHFGKNLPSMMESMENTEMIDKF